MLSIISIFSSNFLIFSILCIFSYFCFGFVSFLRSFERLFFVSCKSCLLSISSFLSIFSLSYCGIFFIFSFNCWHERATFQRSAFGRSTAGNNVVATIFIILFPTVFFPPPCFPPIFSSAAIFSHRRSARIKKLILQKMLRMPKNLGVNTFPDPVGHFGAPGDHFGF